jgi:hypothetical protein
VVVEDGEKEETGKERCGDRELMAINVMPNLTYCKYRHIRYMNMLSHTRRYLIGYVFILARTRVLFSIFDEISAFLKQKEQPNGTELCNKIPIHSRASYCTLSETRCGQQGNNTDM